MKIRIIATIALCFCMAAVCHGQRKELNQAEAYIKSGKDFDKAEKLMTGLLKDSVNRQNKKIYQMWYESVRMQYEAANEKLYLRQKYDTVQFFNLVRRLYLVAETLDSLDARPNKKGRVRIEYRKANAAYTDQLRPNMYYGGTYLVRKGSYDAAYGFFATYLDADRQPLFTGYDYLKRDSMMPQAAYWATLCGYMLNRPDSVLRYHQLALRDSSRREYVLQYVCEAYRQLHNDSAYVALLHDGFRSYPSHNYFFPRLADYYTAANKPDSVLALAGCGLRADADNQLFLLGKSVALLDLERYDECIETSKRLIALNDSMPEPYFNIATTYLNKALELERKNEPRRYRGQLKELYTDARPYMEAYRKLAPDDSHRWAPALYRIYLNLNMGKRFEEIDRVMRKMK